MNDLRSNLEIIKGLLAACVQSSDCSNRIRLEYALELLWDTIENLD